MSKTHQKMVISGSFFEVYHYQQPVPYGPRSSKRNGKERTTGESAKIITYSIYHSKRSVRRWIQGNAWQWRDKQNRLYIPKFVTFTFKENVTELSMAHYQFMKFIKRLNYYLGSKESILKYIVIVEFQKRGAIHYHCLFFNLPYIERVYDEMRRIWSHGFINFQTVDNVKNLASYVTKYMTKGLGDERLFGRKRYFVSHGLNKEMSIRIERTINDVLRAIPHDIEPYRASWPSEYFGKVEYEKYDLGPGKNITDLQLPVETKIILGAMKQSA